MRTDCVSGWLHAILLIHSLHQLAHNFLAHFVSFSLHEGIRVICCDAKQACEVAMVRMTLQPPA